ncbi:MAG TPA: hypothetical protein DEB25_03420 [Desulfobulbaceae bacterium]|nr:hypothetical protein [Desulfobulbaceae bacterium]
MSIWYQLTPADTLFFRGAEPMEAGQLSTNALFPPPVSVIQGALRTAALQQRNISFADYNAGHCPTSLTDVIGKSGEIAPFAVSAVLLKKDGMLYVPCPAHWFTEENGVVGEKILRGHAPASMTVEALGLHSSSGVTLPLVKATDEAKSLAGRWLRLDRLYATEIKTNDLMAASDLYDSEARIGIAIDGKRKVKQGALYSAGHLRLRAGVELVVGTSRDLGLNKTGLLRLGGEQRVCGYTVTPAPDLSTGQASLYLSLAPIELTEDIQPHVFASGKPILIAGWDLHHGFHKASKTWLPAGAVFSKNINNYCLPLPQ